MASKHEPYFSTKMTHDLIGRQQNEFVVSDLRRLPYEPIVLYFRGMEKTGADTKIKGGSTSYQYGNVYTCFFGADLLFKNFTVVEIRIEFLNN